MVGCNPWLLLSYLAPCPAFWERFHATPNHWGYGESHYRELVEYLDSRQDLTSALDLACNEGYFLSILARSGQFQRLAGLDVSARVLARAAQRVSGLQVIRYDLCRLFESHPPPLLPPQQPAYDLCVLSDVLYYLAPFRLSPYVYWSVLPVTWDLPRKRRLLAHCRRLAGRQAAGGGGPSEQESDLLPAGLHAGLPTGHPQLLRGNPIKNKTLLAAGREEAAHEANRGTGPAYWNSAKKSPMPTSRWR